MTDTTYNVYGAGYIPGVPGTFSNASVTVNGPQVVAETTLGQASTLLTMQSLIFSVKDYGAVGDGTTDDTTAIATAINTAVTAGGGVVFFPPGVYLSGPQTLHAKLHFVGAGIEASILKLKNATNADLLSAQVSSINLAASFGTGPAGTLYNFSVQNLTLDGNKAGQSSGTSYPLRFYGYGYIVHNVRIRNGYSGGVLSDWNGGASSPGVDSMESQWSNVKVHDCNGINIQFGGPHDSQFSNVISYSSGLHCFHIAPNAGGHCLVNCHGWGPAPSVGAVVYLIEAGLCLFSNCVAEGSDTVNVVWLGVQCSWSGGVIFGTTANETASGNLATYAAV